MCIYIHTSIQQQKAILGKFSGDFILCSMWNDDYDDNDDNDYDEDDNRVVAFAV